MSKEERVNYILIDTLNSIKIREETREEFDSKMKELLDRNTDILKEANFEILERTGDGILAKGESLSKVIPITLKICKENQDNPIRVNSKDNNSSYRFEQRIIVQSGEINKDVDLNILRSYLNDIEKAENYPTNSVILADGAFTQVVDLLKRSKIGWQDIDIKTKRGEKLRVFYINYKEDGLSYFKGKIPIEKELEELKEKWKELENKFEERIKNLENEKSKLKYATAGLTCTIIILGIFFGIAYPYIDLRNDLSESKNQIENETKKIWELSAEYGKIEKLNLQKTNLDNQSLKEYLDDEEAFKDLISIMQEIENKPMIKYVWLATPDCKEFLYYTHEDKFEEDKDLTNLDWCKGMDNYDVYLTSSYHSSGANAFVTTMVSEIYKDETRREVIGYLGIAIDWKQVHDANQKITEESLFVIIDHNNTVVFACNPKCDYLDNEAKTQLGNGTSEKDLEAKQFRADNFIKKDSLYGMTPLDPITAGKSSYILAGWTLLVN